MRHLLCAQGKGCTGDGSGKVETFGDFPPDLLVNNLHQASFLCHKLIKLVQVQYLLCHDGDAVHWSS